MKRQNDRQVKKLLNQGKKMDVMMMKALNKAQGKSKGKSKTKPKAKVRNLKETSGRGSRKRKRVQVNGDRIGAGRRVVKKEEGPSRKKRKPNSSSKKSVNKWLGFKKFSKPSYLLKTGKCKLADIGKSILPPKSDAIICGVYLFLNKAGTIQYVGHSKTDLRKECMRQSKNGKSKGATRCEWARTKTTEKAKDLERRINTFYEPANNGY